MQLPLIKPVTSWTPPASFPDLPYMFSFDMECKDLGLKEKGPSSFRGGGYPVGISVAYEQDLQIKAHYYPFAHEGGGNMDKGIILRWLKPHLENPNKLLIGANLSYELEWCSWLGIDIKCKLWDVQAAEALLEEEAFSLSLDSICKKRLGKGKEESLLQEALKAFGLGGKEDLWRLPANYVGPYAEGDVADPLLIYKQQIVDLSNESLLEVMELEMQVLSILFYMRRQGVRVDLAHAEKLNRDWTKKEEELYKQWRGWNSNYLRRATVWEPAAIGHAADSLGLKYPLTAKTHEPSFTDAWLQTQTHPFFKQLIEIRSINKLNDTFVKKAFLENHVNGRIHCQFHALRKDDDAEGGSGTRSGRLSCTGPNLQQAPSPEHSEEAWKVRACLIPEEGCDWLKLDYSQQEPRLAVHFGMMRKMKGAMEAGEVYRTNPKADFYQILVDLAKVSRKEAKRLYLGRSYGMGKDKLARSLGLSVEEAQELANKMDSAVPFIKELYYDTMNLAATRGWIKTLAGRRAHFDLWEPAQYNKGALAWYMPLRKELAKAKWPDTTLKRAGTHKAMNRLIQGSAADMTKLAMVAMWRDHKILPMLQVHDELDVNMDCEETRRKAKACMEEAVKLLIPIYADAKIGKNWGEAE
jgi:DNA polymerase I-like protein with 3'-5' exonuclease and polymerase domains